MNFIYRIILILITGILCYVFSLGISRLEKINILRKEKINNLIKEKEEPKHNKIMFMLAMLLITTIILSATLVNTYIAIPEENYYITSSVSMLYIFASLIPLLDAEEKYKIYNMSKTFKIILFMIMSLYVIVLLNIIISITILFF